MERTESKRENAIPTEYLGGVLYRLQQSGIIDKESMDPASDVQFKSFDLKIPFGIEGFRYDRFDIVLERISRPNRPPFVTFFADYVINSTGRHTMRKAYPYDLVLFSGSTALRQINLGMAEVACDFAVKGTFQGQIPPPPGSQGFPYQFFRLIDGVRLDSTGMQDSC